MYKRQVQAARASTETRPVVVVLYGEPGVGRTALALRAAHALRDQFRGACVVDMRGGSPSGESGEAPLSTREALLHLMNRLGAPREQLLFREGASAEQQVRRLGELYHQHLRGLPVTVLLDDAVDAAQVRMLVPERSESLVLVTAREPLELPGDVAAWAHQLPVGRLDGDEAAELVRAVAPAEAAQAEAEAAAGGRAAGVASVVELGGGLPLALRMLAPLVRDGAVAAAGGGGEDGGHPVEVALRAADARLAEPAAGGAGFAGRCGGGRAGRRTGAGGAAHAGGVVGGGSDRAGAGPAVPDA